MKNSKKDVWVYYKTDRKYKGTLLTKTKITNNPKEYRYTLDKGGNIKTITFLKSDEKQKIYPPPKAMSLVVLFSALNHYIKQ